VTPRAWALLACLVAVLLLAMCGCGGSAESVQECGVALEPDAALADVTDEWAGRWSAATGCDVRVESGGIPVLAVEETSIDDETQCGVTRRATHIDGSVSVVRVEIDASAPTGCAQLGYTIAHELGHVLGARGHIESGLMVPRLTVDATYWIDESSLEFICAELGCDVFSPEAPQRDNGLLRK
jgi:hypothetical protein